MSTNPNTIPRPTSDELRKNWQNSKAYNKKSVDIDVDQKYAVVLLCLHANVSQPDDYSALGSAIKDIVGIQDVQLMVDGHTVDSVPDGEKLVAVTKTAIRQVTIPKEEV